VQYVNSGEAVESAVDSRDASAETKLPGVEGKPEGGVENREAK